MPSTRPLTSQQLALQCSEAALDKKAEDLVILDLRGLSSFTDFFIVASGNSEPHLKAVAQGVEEKLREHHQVRPSRVDGFPTSQWVVMDYGDVLVHLFHQTKRSLYALEDLWGDAPRLPLNADAVNVDAAKETPPARKRTTRTARTQSASKPAAKKAAPKARSKSAAPKAPSKSAASSAKTAKTAKTASKKTAG
jgi:ribosome-associated protein